MSSPPSAAQTPAYSACRVIRQPKSKLASAGWTAGGTKGQSIMIPPTGQTLRSVQGDMNEARAKRCRTDYVWRVIFKKTGQMFNGHGEMWKEEKAVRWKEKEMH